MVPPLKPDGCVYLDTLGLCLLSLLVSHALFAGLIEQPSTGQVVRKNSLLPVPTLRAEVGWLLFEEFGFSCSFVCLVEDRVLLCSSGWFGSYLVA